MTLSLPKIYKVEQHFKGPEVSDIPAKISEEISSLNLSQKIKPGQTVAITAGSRGIRHIDEIIKSVVDEMKALGAKPFIIPAMGSHGGGTAEGQREVLSNYNITEETMGCEIRSSMETVVIGKTSLGTDVFLDKYASEADHIAVVNRVKPHTKLIGEIESGLMKMCLIGLGKREGARTYHRAIDHYNWMDIVNSVADTVIHNAPITFGIAILQNAYENIGILKGVKPENFYTEEKELLKMARDLMGKLPFQNVDLMVVDEMGKDISGTGMDTNITGRKDDSTMQVVRVFVRDLTEATHGNAQGIGLADFTTRHLVDQIDYNALYINSQTAYRTDSCKIPMYFNTDSDVLKVATDMAGIDDPAQYKLVWIKNTLELEEIYVSEVYLKDLKQNSDVEICGGPYEIQIDQQGNMISPFSEEAEYNCKQ
jgi:hypothetical protein